MILLVNFRSIELNLKVLLKLLTLKIYITIKTRPILVRQHQSLITPEIRTNQMHMVIKCGKVHFINTAIKIMLKGSSFKTPINQLVKR